MWIQIPLFTILTFTVAEAASQLGFTSTALPLISRRDTSVNATSLVGITPLSLSSDRQSYYTILQVGGINFRVALDSGSSDLWIISSECKTKSCETLPRYPLSYPSPTFTNVNGNSTAFNVSYLDGTGLSGFVAMEKVSLANLTLANQPFGMVTTSNVTLVDETSGVLGLSFPRLSSIPSTVANATPFLVRLVQQGILKYPVFGLSLPGNFTEGTLSIGAVDSSVIKNTSLIGWNQVVDFAPFRGESNVSSYLQWVIPMSAFAVNGTQFETSPTYPNVTANVSLALFDIGTPGIYGPLQDVGRLFSAIESARLVDEGNFFDHWYELYLPEPEEAGQWAVPCDTLETLTFTFGARNYTLQPSDYLIGPTLGDPDLCLSWPRGSPPSADGIDWQIGTAFLRTVYSVFSYGINSKEAPLIGLYPLRNATDTTDTLDSLNSVFSSISATIATTLPNYILPTPSYTTPAYAFNTSVGHLPSGVAQSGLATSTYIPILGPHNAVNISVLPKITPTPALATFIITNSAGVLETSTSTVLEPSVTLGVPPGWSSGTSFLTASLHMAILVPIASWILIYI